jgi:hypothetical protein
MLLNSLDITDSSVIVACVAAAVLIVIKYRAYNRDKANIVKRLRADPNYVSKLPIIELTRDLESKRRQPTDSRR